MNIIELIPHLKDLEKAEALSFIMLPDIEFDLIELYMKDNLKLDSDIVSFDAESIPNELLIEIDGIKYENLFPLYMAQEMVEEYVNIYKNEISDLEIAEKLLDYRRKDA
jgi:hypothetical protein